MIRRFTHERLAAAALLSVPALLTPAVAGVTMTSDPKAPIIPEPIAAEEPKGFFDYFSITGDFRTRYEYVDTDGLDEAWALTLRARLGLLFKYEGFSAFAEYEGTFAADRDSYRPGSVDGLGAGRSVIADPESNELNRAWVAYSGFDTDIKVGRQRIILDNARFVGNVGWRQNEQTFDAVTIKNTSIEDLTLFYGVVNRVNRIFGSNNIRAAGQRDFDDGVSHLVNISYSGLPFAKLTTYAYFLDLENDAGNANSNNTFGVSLSGAIPAGEDLKFPWYAEFAYQTDAFDSPLDYDTVYYHGKFGLDYKGTTLGVGYENLGSDNGVGFRTPLATLHAFNGFNDVFLNTPGEGLQDLYVYAGTKLPYGIALKAWFHLFGEDAGSFEYGNEVDVVLAKKINKNLSVLGKFGSYQADDFGADEQLYSIQVDYKF